MSLEHLGDVKAGSIAEWVAFENVRRAIQKHFRSFLMTYVDEKGQSVYGQRIKHLGEGKLSHALLDSAHLPQSTLNPSRSPSSTWPILGLSSPTSSPTRPSPC